MGNQTPTFAVQTRCALVITISPKTGCGRQNRTGLLAYETNVLPLHYPAINLNFGAGNGIRTHTVGILSPLPPADCAIPAIFDTILQLLFNVN